MLESGDAKATSTKKSFMGLPSIPGFCSPTSAESQKVPTAIIPTSLLAAAAEGQLLPYVY